MGTGTDKTKAAVALTGRSEKLGSKEIRASLVALVSPRLLVFPLFSRTDSIADDVG